MNAYAFRKIAIKSYLNTIARGLTIINRSNLDTSMKLCKDLFEDAHAQIHIPKLSQTHTHA